MDVFFDLPSDLPKHEPPPLDTRPNRLVASWPLGTFVENLLVLPDGDLVVALHSESALQRVSLGGTIQALAELPAPPTGMVQEGRELFVLAGIPGQTPGRLFRVSFDGTVEPWVDIEGSLFLNGATPFFPGSILAVDSVLGIVYRIYLHDRRVEPWFNHDLLRKITKFALLPGANGIKIFGKHVYISNTDRAIIVRIEIQPNGQAGRIETVAEHFRADDFCFDTHGNGYFTTHIENSLVRLAPDGTRLAVAGAEQSMAGSTAARFGRTPETETTLFVTTTGGLIGPYQGVAQPAKLIAIDIGIAGHPVDFLSDLKETV